MKTPKRILEMSRFMRQATGPSIGEITRRMRRLDSDRAVAGEPDYEL